MFPLWPKVMKAPPQGNLEQETNFRCSKSSPLQEPAPPLPVGMRLQAAEGLSEYAS